MVAYYNEINPYAAQWLRNLIAEGAIAPGVVDERSIVDVQPQDLAWFCQVHMFAGIGVWSYALRKAGWPDDEPVWSGSCPCQSYSVAGLRKGHDDERNLWPDFYRLIRACRPPVIFGEQVSSSDVIGPSSGVLKDAGSPAWIDVVQADLERAHYTTGAVVTNAACVGAPHERERLYWVAHAPDERWTREHTLLREGSERGRLAQDRAEVAGGGQVDGLADTDSLVGGQSSAHGGRRTAGGNAQQGARPECCSVPNLVADSNSIGDNGCGLSGPGGWFEHPNGGVPSLVGNSNIAGLEGQDLGRHSANERTLGAPSLVVQRPGPVNGAWAIADWLFCTDGLWRPAESGSSALVDRTAVDMGSLFPDGTHPFRTEGPWAKGMIEGYGNAIVAPLAEMFIRAYMGLK